MKRIILLFFIVMLCMSCNGKYRGLFNKLAKEADKNADGHNILYTMNFNGVESSNAAYKQIYSAGKKINDYLLSEAYSDDKTNWETGISGMKLYRGDIAILLLAEINYIRVYQILPDDIDLASLLYDGGNNINGNLAFWKWVHQDAKNREYVILKIKGIIKKNKI